MTVYRLRSLLICICVSCVSLLCFIPSVSAQTITNLGDGITLTDIGLNPLTNELVFVGSEDESGVDAAKVFRLSPDRTSLSSETLVGLGANTEVRGISSDGSRAAGVSESPAAIFGFPEGISWSLDAPSSPQGIGFVLGANQTSQANAAWSGGVAGNHSGLDDGIFWTEQDGIAVLPDAGGLSSVNSVNSEGNFFVGNSSNFGAVTGAAYWDSPGINQLEDPFGISSVARAVAPNSQYIAGDIEFFDADTFETGTQAAVWSNFNNLFALELLQIEDPDTMMLERLLGTVNDVSLSGYAVGETLDGRGFIWHESFNGVDTEFLGAQIFDDWLLQTEGLTLDSLSRSISGIAEDDFGNLHFAVNGSAFIVSDVRTRGVPEPSSVVLLTLVSAPLLLRRRRS